MLFSKPMIRRLLFCVIVSIALGVLLAACQPPTDLTITPPIDDRTMKGNPAAETTDTNTPQPTITPTDTKTPTPVIPITGKTGGLTGKVVTYDSGEAQPVKGATVTLIKIDELIWETITPGDGSFLKDGIDAGQYLIRFYHRNLGEDSFEVEIEPDKIFDLKNVMLSQVAGSVGGIPPTGPVYQFLQIRINGQPAPGALYTIPGLSMSFYADENGVVYAPISDFARSFIYYNGQVLELDPSVAPGSILNLEEMPELEGIYRPEDIPGMPENWRNTIPLAPTISIDQPGVIK